MSEQQKELSPALAVTVGAVIINGTVMVLMFGPGGLGLIVGALLRVSPVWGLFLFPIGWCAAWGAWSVMIPLWRIWAYGRVSNLDELKRQAVEAKLIWPEGHRFQRTEIMTRSTRDRIAALERDGAS